MSDSTPPRPDDSPPSPTPAEYAPVDVGPGCSYADRYDALHPGERKVRLSDALAVLPPASWSDAAWSETYLITYADAVSRPRT